MLNWLRKNIGLCILITFSLVWSVGSAILLINALLIDDFYGGMPLNEIGDYLAGAFSPLAFMWLVYGYFMQNKELSLNRIELSDNKKALRNTVIGQKKMLQLHKLNMEKETNKELPIFNITSANYYPSGTVIPEITAPRTSDKNELSIYIENHGAMVKNMYISMKTKSNEIKTDKKNIKNSNQYEFRLCSNETVDKPIIVKIHFITASLNIYSQSLIFDDLDLCKHSLKVITEGELENNVN